MNEVVAYIQARVTDDGDCWRWNGCASNRHPSCRIDGRQVMVRRAVWQSLYGAIPAGMIIRCTCETALCVNPEHLALTTHKAVAIECGALGLMSGPVRSARIAATKRAGKQAKITQQQAREIRESNELGTVLAVRYGIEQATVSKIRLGKVRRDFGAALWALPVMGAA